MPPPHLTSPPRKRGRRGIELSIRSANLTTARRRAYTPALPLPGTWTDPIPWPAPAVGFGQRPTGAKIDLMKGQRANDQARREQVQDQSPVGRQPMGPRQVPHRQARLRTWAARPAPQEAHRLRYAADGQTEAERLLRQHRRKAVPQIL